jgi:hypothetical protein
VTSLMRQLAFSMVALCMLLIEGTGCAQSSTDQAKQALARPFPAEAENSKRELLAAGVAAVDVIEGEFRSKMQTSHVRLAFLVDVLLSFKSPRAYAVVYDLLSDSRPFVRGNIVQQLGRKKVYCAVPQLTQKLADDTEFAQDVSTDPYRTKSLSVSGAALVALGSITGVAQDRRESAASSKPKFEKWWERNRNRFSCPQ